MLLGVYNADTRALLRSRGDSIDDPSLPEDSEQPDITPMSLDQRCDDDGVTSNNSDFDIETFVDSDLFEEEIDSTTYTSQAAVGQHIMPELASMR